MEHSKQWEAMCQDCIVRRDYSLFTELKKGNPWTRAASPAQVRNAGFQVQPGPADQNLGGGGSDPRSWGVTNPVPQALPMDTQL